MWLDFDEELPYIRNEYTDAHFDERSGMPAAELEASMRAWLKAHAKEPAPIIHARLFEMLLANCQIELNIHTVFPEKINHGVVYRPDNASGGILERILNERYRRALEEGAPEAWAARRVGWECGATCPDLDVWHVCPDWQRLLSLGFSGIRAELAERREALRTAGMLTEERDRFYASSLIEYDAVLALMRRLRDAVRTRALHPYAQALDGLTQRAPQTLYEVMVLSRLYLTVQETGRERARTYGAIDRMWYPYYLSDLEAGRLTERDALDLLRFFLIKTAAEQRFADQPLCLSGSRAGDDPGITGFACLILDAYDGLGIHNPKLHIRCAKDMDRPLMRKLLDMIRRGHNSIVLLNDEAVYAGYEKIGVPRTLSATYLPTGCYEPVLPGVEDARICSAWINLSKPAELALTGGENILADTPRFGISTPTALPAYEDYLDAFACQLRHQITLSCDVLDALYACQHRAYAAPLLSGTIASCVREGKDVFSDGMEIRNLSLKCFAIGTAVDSLMAVKKVVYEERSLTAQRFADALRANWAGHEALRQQVLADRRKWGNNMPEVDQLAKWIYDMVWDLVKDRGTPNGGRYRIGCDSVAQADYGHRQGATPDGRLAGTLLSKNMRPSNGMERGGITSLMLSVASLDASRFVDAAPLDFWLHPSAVEGAEGLDAFLGLVDTFFALGGFALHGNVLSTQMLLDAQANPGLHKNLQIRVCGWNEYFVNLSRELQDDFIARSRGIEQ